MSSVLLPVLTHAKIRSWPTRPNGGRARYLSIAECMTTRFAFDAHVQQCSYPAIPRRLSKKLSSTRPTPTLSQPRAYRSGSSSSISITPALTRPAAQRRSSRLPRRELHAELVLGREALAHRRAARDRIDEIAQLGHGDILPSSPVGRAAWWALFRSLPTAECLRQMREWPSADGSSTASDIVLSRHGHR